MKKLLILILLLSSCKGLEVIQKQPEQFGIYHISTKGDTTFLNWSDLKVLQIDSLQDKHLELNAER